MIWGAANEPQRPRPRAGHARSAPDKSYVIPIDCAGGGGRGGGRRRALQHVPEHTAWSFPTQTKTHSGKRLSGLDLGFLIGRRPTANLATYLKRRARFPPVARRTRRCCQPLSLRVSLIASVRKFLYRALRKNEKFGSRPPRNGYHLFHTQKPPMNEPPPTSPPTLLWHLFFCYAVRPYSNDSYGCRGDASREARA